MADERGWTTAPVHRPHACLLVFVAFHGARLSRLASTIPLQAMCDGCLHTVAPCRRTADACHWPAATCRVWRASLPVERAVRASCAARVLPACPLPREPISCRPPGCGRCTPCRQPRPRPLSPPWRASRCLRSRSCAPRARRCAGATPADTARTCGPSRHGPFIAAPCTAVAQRAPTLHGL